MEDLRLDILVTLKTGYPRSYAQEIIRGGRVFVNGKKILKPGAKAYLLDNITIDALPPKFVSRGGLKLQEALSAFCIDVTRIDCLDVGASTGGFTDCLLQSGANSVTAIDVGSGQLSKALEEDDRVISHENTDIRDFISDTRFSFICADVSFISLSKIMTDISRLLADDGIAVLLIKPQFEVGRGAAISESARKHAVKNVKISAEGAGLMFMGLIESPVRGGDGNIEFLAYFKKSGEGA